MKITKALVIGCVALSGLVLTVPAEARDKHKHKDKHKQHRDDRSSDHRNGSYYGRSSGRPDWDSRYYGNDCSRGGPYDWDSRYYDDYGRRYR